MPDKFNIANLINLAKSTPLKAKIKAVFVILLCLTIIILTCIVRMQFSLNARNAVTIDDQEEKIAELMDKRGKLTLTQLSHHFPEVSQMTLRRDLLVLEQEGRLIRIGGGAMSVKEVQ